MRCEPTRQGDQPAGVHWLSTGSLPTCCDAAMLHRGGSLRAVRVAVPAHAGRSHRCMTHGMPHGWGIGIVMMGCIVMMGRREAALRLRGPSTQCQLSAACGGHGAHALPLPLPLPLRRAAHWSAASPSPGPLCTCTARIS